MGVDHPIAWCHNYDGGRAWYTGGGHTSESYGESRFRRHLLGGIKWAANLVAGECGATEWGNFERVTLAKGAEETGEPIGLAVLPDRGVLHTARDGVVRYTDASGATKVAATIPVYNHDEDGLQAITLDPGFATNRWVYVYYAPPLSTPAGDAPFDGTPEQFAAFKGVNRLSRFKWDPAAKELDLASEQKLLEVDQDRGICCHNGGDFAWDAAGNLYLSTGDDTNPFESQGSAPIDERADAQPGLRRPAQRGQHERPARQDPAHQAATRRPRATASRAATCSRRARPAGGPRSTRWASATRSGSPSTRETGHVYVGDYGPDGGGGPAARPRRPGRVQRRAPARQLRLALLHRGQRAPTSTTTSRPAPRARRSTAPRR